MQNSSRVVFWPQVSPAHAEVSRVALRLALFIRSLLTLASCQPFSGAYRPIYLPSRSPDLRICGISHALLESLRSLQIMPCFYEPLSNCIKFQTEMEDSQTAILSFQARHQRPAGRLFQVALGVLTLYCLITILQYGTEGLSDHTSSGSPANTTVEGVCEWGAGDNIGFPLFDV